MKKEIADILSSWIAKLLPALVAVLLEIAIEIKQKKATVISAVISLAVGLGSAYLFAPLIEENTNKSTYPIAIGFTAIISKKFFEWFLSKIEDKGTFESIYNVLFMGFRNFINNKTKGNNEDNSSNTTTDVMQSQDTTGDSTDSNQK